MLFVNSLKMMVKQKVEYFCTNKDRWLKSPKKRFRFKCEVVTSHIMEALLESSIKTIEDMCSRLTAYDTMSSEEYFSHYREQVYLNRNQWPRAVGLQRDEYEPKYDTIVEDIAFLSSLNALNKQALILVRAGRPIIDKEIYVNNTIIANNLSTSHNIYTIWSVLLIDGVLCTNCRTLRERSEMSKHQLHPECLIEADKQRMVSADYVKIDSIENVIAIRSAGIKHDMISEFWACYVPKWVQEAVIAFEKSGGNYAGMTLEEFLKSIKPEGELK